MMTNDELLALINSLLDQKQFQEQNSFVINMEDIASKLKDEGVIILGSEISKFKNVNKLVLQIQNNHVSEKGINFLTQGLSQFTHLTHLNLNLRGNFIWENGAQSLSKFVQSLQQVKYLNMNLENNSIQNSGLEHLSDAIGQCSKLNILILNLKGNSITNYFGMINQVKKLKYLYFLQICLNIDINRVIKVKQTLQKRSRMVMFKII
ncbi:kinase domain protein, putative (macronuclear) [Tetrahymena thermophila SB210]|uniref:Kinase domain protein, putative n=1 Tax=Tetrahymena thermophila (strain SB210) TaxID=312017 RepID=A4VDI8_TETTS|nr:kinase domain protein, putative [Tetrahymena thermophila SB210]EDK31589.2 kinase domain protein, putative [Tetrahymena thermophila SB210]|eukprot:XP_001471404.2 kinase domain protein, putative [Tetrahymena thermophila SB210]